MIKGTKKKVIMMRKTGSGLFDEAYFIISEAAEKSGVTEGEMVREANRIIERNSISYRRAAGDKGSGRLKYYLFGVISCGAVLISAWLIFGF